MAQEQELPIGVVALAIFGKMFEHFQVFLIGNNIMMMGGHL